MKGVLEPLDCQCCREEKMYLKTLSIQSIKMFWLYFLLLTYESVRPPGTLSPYLLPTRFVIDKIHGTLYTKVPT